MVKHKKEGEEITDIVNSMKENKIVHTDIPNLIIGYHTYIK